MQTISAEADLFVTRGRTPNRKTTLNAGLLLFGNDCRYCELIVYNHRRQTVTLR